MNFALTALQLIGVLAVLVGVAILLPLGWAVLVDGVVVVLVATIAEYIAHGRPGAPSAGRTEKAGAA